MLDYREFLSLPDPQQKENGAYFCNPQTESHERRIIDPDTGGAKGQKLARFDLIPPGPMWQVAEHYGVGAAKYEDRNWEAGYRWSLSYGALQRHAHLFWSGEEVDAESGTHHLAAVVFHALALMQFASTHPAGDDRPSRL